LLTTLLPHPQTLTKPGTILGAETGMRLLLMLLVFLFCATERISHSQSTFYLYWVLQQHILPRSKLYGSNSGLILPHCCNPKESRCHDTTSSKSRQGSPFFHFTIYKQHLCKKYTIKMYQMMSSSCYFTPQRTAFLLISSLVKSQNTHFSCCGFGLHH